MSADLDSGFEIRDSRSASRVANLRFYEELNDFLPPDKRKRRFAHRLKPSQSVREILNDLGVPCAEVEMVLVNGESVSFSHRPEDGDFVSIYPVFESLNVKPLVRVRAAPLRNTRFLVSKGLRRLARRLRSLGFDTLDCSAWSWETIVRVTEEERRILLTRETLQGQEEIARAYVVRHSRPGEQLFEVLSRFDLLFSVDLSDRKLFS
jgi:hypothetical protein